MVVNTSVKAVFYLSLFFPISVFSSEDKPSNISEKSNKVETIEVTGQRSKAYYERLLFNSIFDFYDAYNAVASNDDFKIKCKRHPKKDSYGMTRRWMGPKECQSRFVNKILNEYRRPIFSDTESTMLSGSGMRYTISERKIKELIQEQRAKQVADMAAQIDATPALKKKFEKLKDAKLRHAKRVSSDDD